MKSLLTFVAALMICNSVSANSVDNSWVDPLRSRLEIMADSLTKNLVPWQVPKKIYKVESFGAKGDGVTMNTVAIQSAIDRCSERGGGVVLLSKGDYVTGTLELKSGVMIEVAKGVRILGSTDLKDYPERIEALKSIMSEYYRFRQSLIYAEGADRVGIRGEGEIYFRGEKEHFKSPQTTGYIEGRPVGIRMVECSNVVVQDILLRNSASWMQNYVACNNLIFDGMRVINQANFNNDGLDPDGCTNVIVRNCVINSEDDAMCLKGASDLPSRNILIENSTFVSTCNAFKVGTDTQGDFKDILVRNVILGGTPEGMESIRGRRASTGITIATVDGGDIEDLVMQNVTINQSRCPIFIRIGDRGRVITDQKPKPGRIERVLIENVTGERNQSQGSFISGIADYMVSDVTIKNYNVKIEGGGTASMVLQNVVEGVDGYPDAHQFSPQGLPAYGFYFRHAKNISMEGMRVTPIAPDQRPEIYNGGDAYNILYNDLFIKDLFIPPWKRRQMEAAAAKLKAQQAATK